MTNGRGILYLPPFIPRMRAQSDASPVGCEPSRMRAQSLIRRGGLGFGLYTISISMTKSSGFCTFFAFWVTTLGSPMSDLKSGELTGFVSFDNTKIEWREV